MSISACVKEDPAVFRELSSHPLLSGFQTRSKDQEILEEGGGAGPSS